MSMSIANISEKMEVNLLQHFILFWKSGRIDRITSQNLQGTNQLIY